MPWIFTFVVLSPRLCRTGLPWGPCPMVWLKLLETVWFLARFRFEEESPDLDGGGGGGLEEGWTKPGEPEGPRGVRFGLVFGTEGLGLEGGGGGADDARGGAEEGKGGPLVGVDPTGLGLGERLGEEFYNKIKLGVIKN